MTPSEHGSSAIAQEGDVERNRTSNGRKRSGQFALWMTYKSMFRQEPVTYKFRTYADRDVAEKVGRDLIRKSPEFYTAFDIRT